MKKIIAGWHKQSHMTKRLLAMTGVMAFSITAYAVDLPFDVATIAYEVAPRERTWDGTVEAVNQGTVSAQTSGRVAEIFYDVNDFVAANEIIMRFTDVEQSSALKQANAALAESQARLNEANSDFQRIEAMYRNETVSKARFEQSEANKKAAEARLSAARSQVATATKQLEYTVVRAPYAGIVSKRYIEVGEMVSPGQPLMSGLSLESLRVNVDVPQSMFEPIRQIGKAFIYANGERIEAAGLTFYPVADAVSNTFRVRVQMPEGSATLYPGMFVKVGFVVGETKRLLIPDASVVRRSELSAVYVVKDERVFLRQIRLGRDHADRMEVLAGLNEGEQIALDPVKARIYLKDQQGVADQHGN